MMTATATATATRDLALQILSDRETINKVIAKTKMCRETMKGKQCCRNDCGFAHTKDELSLPKCLFGDSCRIIGDAHKPCLFTHPCDNPVTYKLRTGHNWPLDIVVPPLKVKLTKGERVNQEQMKREEAYINELRQLEAEEEKARQMEDEKRPQLYREPAPVTEVEDDFDDLVVFVTLEDEARWKAEQARIEAEQAHVEAEQARIEAERKAADAQRLADEMELVVLEKREEASETAETPMYYVAPPRNINVVFNPEQFAFLFPQLTQMGVFFQSQPDITIHAVLTPEQFAFLFPQLTQMGVFFQTQ